jgi:large subunit ribosomal protein L25
MQTQELTITRRQETGKQVAKRLRRSGVVPAVLYGGAKAELVSIDPRSVLRILHGGQGSTQLLTLRFEGESSSLMAIIRDIQFDPVSDSLVHVDLQEVRADRAITVRVTVHPVGEAAGVKDQKGILQIVVHELDVSCLPTVIPERIDADVSALMIGNVLTVADLKVPEGVRILNSPDQAVFTVAPPMAEEVAAPVAAAAPAEPEVLTERKPKEGEEAAAAATEEAKKEPAKKERPERAERGERAKK